MLQQGETIGKWRVDRVLGEGGMGADGFKIVRNETGTPFFGECLESLLESASFQAPGGGGIAIVTWPITFSER